MATLYISEFNGHAFVGANSNQSILIPSAQGLNAFQNISISTSSAASAAFNSATRWLKLVTDTNCWINFGGSGVTAAITNDYLPANTIYYVAVQPGTYLAAIT